MKKIFFDLIVFSAILLLGSPAFAQNISLTASAHVEDYGDMNSTTGNRITIGTTGEAKRMEAFTLKTDNPNVGVSYQGHVQDIGWQEPVQNGEVAGTKGQAKRIECFRLNITGSEAGNYDLYYRSHVENYGWLDWAKNGESSGTAQHGFRCEALEIAIVPKDSGAPNGESTYMPAIEAFDREEGRNMFLVNMLRKAEGQPYLTGHPQLHEVAEQRVKELYHFSHTRPDGRDCFTMMDDLYPDSNVFFCGENIAAGGGSDDHAALFYDMWNESPGHHQNMVTGRFKYMGYGELVLGFEDYLAGNYLFPSYGVQCFGEDW